MTGLKKMIILKVKRQQQHPTRHLQLSNPHQLSLNTSDEPLSLICPYYRDCLGIGMRYLIAKQLVSFEPYSISHDITCQHYTKCNIIAYSHDFKNNCQYRQAINLNIRNHSSALTLTHMSLDTVDLHKLNFINSRIKGILTTSNRSDNQTALWHEAYNISAH